MKYPGKNKKQIMKKISLSFVVLLIASMSLFAQYNQEELLKEMQDLQEEMKKQFENFDLNFGDAQFLIDTFYIQKMEPIENLQHMEFYSGDLSEMMDMLQKQMEGVDWKEMEKLFKSFGDFTPLVPLPENFEEFKKQEGDIIKKSNKNWKSYTL